MWVLNIPLAYINWPLVIIFVAAGGWGLLTWLSPASLRDRSNYCLARAAQIEAGNRAFEKVRRLPGVAAGKAKARLMEQAAMEQAGADRIVSIKSVLRGFGHGAAAEEARLSRVE